MGYFSVPINIPAYLFCSSRAGEIILKVYKKIDKNITMILLFKIQIIPSFQEFFLVFIAVEFHHAGSSPVCIYEKILLSNRDKINATQEGKSHWTFAPILT